MMVGQEALLTCFNPGTEHQGHQVVVPERGFPLCLNLLRRPHGHGLNQARF